MLLKNREYVYSIACVWLMLDQLIKLLVRSKIPLLEEIQGYSLADRMRDNFISEKQLASPEIMFSVRYLAPNITHSMDLYYGNWTTCGVTRDLVDEFECTDGLKWGESPLTQEVDESLLSTNSMADDAYNEREKLLPYTTGKCNKRLTEDMAIEEQMKNDRGIKEMRERLQATTYTRSQVEDMGSNIKLIRYTSNPSKYNMKVLLELQEGKWLIDQVGPDR